MQPQVRDTKDVTPEVWDDPVRGNVSFRVLFSADRTSTSSLYTGFAELPPAGWLGCHRHTQAEVYHVVEGRGVVVLDGDEHPSDNRISRVRPRQRRARHPQHRRRSPPIRVCVRNRLDRRCGVPLL
jgi:hypothetical protein